MNIDYKNIQVDTIDNIFLDEDITLDKEYYKDSSIKDFTYIHVKGNIFKDIDDLLKAKLLVNGEMIIEDSITLDDVKYPFNIEIDDNLSEFLKKSPNILDIFEFLWENIVLEVPLTYTEVDDLSKFHGDGWSLRDEDDIVIHDNPFSELLKNFDKE